MAGKGMSMREFSARLKVLSDGINTNTETLVRKTALAALQAVVVSTPVDTGRARSNWLVTKGSPSDGTVDPVSAASVLADGGGTISSYKLGDTLYITNNLPYIQRLNEGWSKQAPANFVQRAVAQARQLIANTKVTPP